MFSTPLLDERTTTAVDDMVPSAASSMTVPAAVGGAIAGCIILVILITMTIVIFTMWMKRNKKWTIGAANGVAQTNEYPMTNPIYKGKFCSDPRQSMCSACKLVTLFPCCREYDHVYDQQHWRL